LLGTAGASFAVALPLVSRWYAQERQGLVMGVAAAGNSGTVIANLAAPRLASEMGWHNVLGLAMLPLAVVLVAFLLMAKDRPEHSRALRVSHLLGALKQRDLWWLCLLYSVTFGGYVGLASFLPIFLRDQYQVSPVTAGYLAALAAFTGSGLRPLGGFLADRFGGVRVLFVLLAAIACVYALVAQLPPLLFLMGLIAVGMACLGMGNGAVFQLVPARFAAEIGVATGVIGALGGLGGFLLPNLLGTAKGMSGSFGPGFLTLSAVAVGAFLLLRGLRMAHLGWPFRPLPGGVGFVGSALSPTGRVMMAPYLEL
jgi:NNP family nitrate/nitrite transporter-like MFS transporter